MTVINFTVQDSAGATASGTVTASVTSAAPITLGDPNIANYPSVDSGNGNLLCAQKVTLNQAATTQSLSFFVVTTSGSLRLGMYDATGTGGNPGNKVAETASFTPVAGWNTQPVLTPALLQPGTYWLAYLPQNNNLAFKKVFQGTFAHVTRTFNYGPMPSSFGAASPPSGSNWSIYATLTTTPPVPDTTAPSAPTNLTGVGISTTQISLTWTPSTDNVAVTGYRIYRNGGTTAVGTSATASFVDNGLTANTGYTYAVEAFDAAGNTSVRMGGGGVIRTLTTQPASTGWTTFVASGSGNTQIIYVSQSTGNDGTGVIGDVNHPYKTLATATALLRSGKADWLLLKQNDTWTNEDLTGFNGVGLGFTALTTRADGVPTSISGQILFSSYDKSQPGVANPFIPGNLRPVIQTSATANAVNFNSSNTCGSFVALYGLNLYSYTRDPANGAFDPTSTTTNSPNGINIVHTSAGQTVTGFWVEDCLIHFYANNITMDIAAGSSNITVRRCLLLDSYVNDNLAHSAGMYIARTDSILLEENVIDHNGWNTSGSLANAGPTVFNQNIYAQFDCSNLTFQNNITSQASASGIEHKTGSKNYNNLYILNPVQLEWGGGTIDAACSNGSGGGTCSWNVFLEACNLSDALPRANNIDIYGNSTPTDTSNNLIAWVNETGSGTRGSGTFGDGHGITATNCVTIPGYTASNNRIYHQTSPIDNSASPGSSITFSNNDQDANGTNNNPGGLAPNEPYPSPNPIGASIMADYYASIGSPGGFGATTFGFILAARTQSKNTWNNALMAQQANNYVRPRFGMSGSIS